MTNAIRVDLDNGAQETAIMTIENVKVTREEYAKYISTNLASIVHQAYGSEDLADTFDWVKDDDSEDLKDGASRMVWRDKTTGEIKAIATYRNNPNTHQVEVTYEICKCMRKVTRKEYAKYISTNLASIVHQAYGSEDLADTFDWVKDDDSEDLKDGDSRMVWRDKITGKIKAIATYRKNPNTRHVDVTYEIYK